MKADSIAVRFLQQFLEDREQGTVRSLDDYQRMFPSAPEIIAREYESVTSPEEEPFSSKDSAPRYAEPRTIGRGGMGTVEEVLDSTLDRRVARKLLGDGGDTVPPPDVLRRFQHEARIMARLQHPGIVPIHDLGFDERGRPYFTMPLIEGSDLATVVRRREEPGSDWPHLRGVELVARVAEAVAHAHDRGVVHRDLKPSNVMVGEHGEAYVVDWGLACVLDESTPDNTAGESATGDEPELTGDGVIVGTPAYMSPEQARGDRAAVDRRSDVYSLGSMLYHVLTGSPPYLGQGGAATGRETREALLAGPPPPVASLSSTVPPELVSICDRAMAREPGARYQTAGELAVDLRAFLENRVVRAHAVGPVAELRTWVRRNRLSALLIATTVVALAAGLVVSLQMKSTADENAAEAEAQAISAEENFELAFEVTESLLVEFGLFAAEDDPATDPIRQALAERALAYYQRFRELRSTDPRLADKVALSQFRIGSLAARLGQIGLAESALAQAEQQFSDLVASGDDRRAHRIALVEIAVERGVLEMNRGNLDRALAQLARANGAAATLLDDGSKSQSLLFARATGLHNLAVVHSRREDRETGIALLQDKLEVTRALRQAAPELARADEIHASGLSSLGKLLDEAGQHDEARRHLTDAIAVLDESLERHPQARRLRQRLCEVLNVRAANARNLGAIDDSIEVSLRAIDIGRQLVAANPQVRDFQGNLAGSLCNTAMMKRSRDRPETILELLLEARTHARAALHIDPEHAAFARYRAIIGRELARACLVLNKAEETAQHVRELLDEQPGRHDWMAAVMFASCATLSQRDGGLESAEKQRRIRRYGDDAMFFLRTSVDHGTYQPQLIQDASFDALRERDDFRSLVRQQGR